MSEQNCISEMLKTHRILKPQFCTVPTHLTLMFSKPHARSTIRLSTQYSKRAHHSDGIPANVASTARTACRSTLYHRRMFQRLLAVLKKPSKKLRPGCSSALTTQATIWVDARCRWVGHAILSCFDDELVVFFPLLLTLLIRNSLRFTKKKA